MTAASSAATPGHGRAAGLRPAMMMAVLGVVYGDIGTSRCMR